MATQASLSELLIPHRLLMICWYATQLNEINIVREKTTCIFRPIILPKLQHARHLVLLNFKLPNEMLNIENGSEEGNMSHISGNQNIIVWLLQFVCRVIRSCHVSDFTLSRCFDLFLHVRRGLPCTLPQ